MKKVEVISIDGTEVDCDNEALMNELENAEISTYYDDSICSSDIRHNDNNQQ